MTFVHVADGHDVTETRGVFGVTAPHATAADERDAGPVIRTGTPPGRTGSHQLPLEKPQRQAGHGGGAEKMAAVDLKWRL